MEEIREYLKKNKLIFDGGMGTYFASVHHETGRTCEVANIEHPEYILDIHREYLNAGSRAIKTNTFAANQLSYNGDRELLGQVVKEGCRIAKQAVREFSGEKEDQAYVFASIGPMRGVDDDILKQMYRWQCEMFLAEGVQNFLFETHDSSREIVDAAAFIKSQAPDAFVTASFAVLPDGYTREGAYIQELVDSVMNTDVDAVGMNCVSSALHMKELLEKLDTGSLPVSVMPNAGYPKIVNNRSYFDSDPLYFGEQMAKIAAMGANILGGCCGTDPRFIAAIVQQLGTVRGQTVRRPKVAVRPGAVAAKSRAEELVKNPFWRKLDTGSRVIAVELDPPLQSSGAKFMAGAWKLKEAGADAITISDCPTARVRMDSSLLACKLRRELGIETIPHMTCRDRNINATKALLLGLSMEGVHNVLVVTGDPIPTAERDEVKSVYQFNSRMLAKFIDSLNRNELEDRFRVYGALNVNARNFDMQLKLAREKMANGVSCFMTQPVCSEEALENLKRAHGELGARILGGIIPTVSSRNARFMNSEINGIYIADCIATRYEGRTKEECTEIAVETSTEIAERIRPYCDGYYLMTPFSRTDIIVRIIENIRKF